MKVGYTSKLKSKKSNICKRKRKRKRKKSSLFTYTKNKHKNSYNNKKIITKNCRTKI